MVYGERSFSKINTGRKEHLGAQGRVRGNRGKRSSPYVRFGTFDLEQDELDDLMLDNGFERCPGCEWFVETSELLDDDSEPKQCDNCQPR